MINMENIIFIKNYEDFLKLERPSNMKKTSICFKCEICGKDVYSTYYNIFCDKRCLCRKHKIEKTLIKNYGSIEAGRKENNKHGLETKRKNGSLKKWNEKLQQTMVEKYGVSNPGQMENHYEKCKKTMEKNFGSYEEGLKVSIEKGKKTKIEHYGENYGSIIWKRIMDNFGVENYSQTEDWKRKHLKKACERISKFANIIEKNGNYYLHCDKCGNDHLQQVNDVWTRCFDCFPLNSINGYSTGEIELKDFLNKYKTFEKRKKIFIGRGKLECDMYCDDLKLGVEFDGIYWHKSFNKNSALEKYNLAKKSGFRLIRIFDEEYFEKREIIKNILKTTIGFYGKKIFARKCTVKEISNKEYKTFVENNHIQGYVGASIKIGLFYENELVEIMSFAHPRYSRNYEWEMMRECSKEDYQIVGGKGKLFSYFVKNYKPKSIVSYCEKRLFTGKSYERLGFIKEKDSPPSFKVYWKSKVYHRSHFTKVNMKKLDGFKYDETLTQMDNLKLNDAYPVFDCGNFVFSWKSSN